MEFFASITRACALQMICTCQEENDKINCSYAKMNPTVLCCPLLSMSNLGEFIETAVRLIEGEYYITVHGLYCYS